MTLHLILPNIGRTRQFDRRLAMIGSASTPKSVALLNYTEQGRGMAKRKRIPAGYGISAAAIALLLAATPAFAQGLAELMSLAATPTAIMCAEAVW